MPSKLTAEIIAAAIAGFEEQKHEIDTKIVNLRSMLHNGASQPAMAEGTPRGRRRISAAARRRMALAQKARWAKFHAESGSPAPEARKEKKPKRRISKEGLERIVAATKKRWALRRAEQAAQSQSAAGRKMKRGKKAARA